MIRTAREYVDTSSQPTSKARDSSNHTAQSKFSTYTRFAVNPGELMTLNPLLRVATLPPPPLRPAPGTVDRTSIRSNDTSGASEMSTP